MKPMHVRLAKMVLESGKATNRESEFLQNIINVKEENLSTKQCKWLADISDRTQCKVVIEKDPKMKKYKGFRQSVSVKRAKTGNKGMYK